MSVPLARVVYIILIFIIFLAKHFNDAGIMRDAFSYLIIIMLKIMLA